MLRLIVIGLFLATAAPALAQPPPPFPPENPGANAQRPTPAPQPGKTLPTPPSPPSGDTPAIPVPTPPRPTTPSLPVNRFNIQIELTISDQTGTAAPEKKTVSMLIADRTFGRIRASADASGANMGRVGTTLNVDARPSMMEGNIYLELTVEYRPLLGNSDAARSPTNLNESLSVILTNGKALMVSQAADPISDRKMTVEVKATILK